MIDLPQRLALKLVVALGCLMLLALLVQDRNRWKAKTAHYADLLAGERAARAGTLANVRAAVEQARQADRANAARVRRDQEDINDRSKDEFESRIAAARAAAERLRPRPAAAADPRHRRGAAVPALPAAAGGAAEGAGQDRLPDADRLIATEQAIQLEALIEWTRRQHAVQQ